MVVADDGSDPDQGAHTLDFAQVDVFCTQAFSGNPVAVVFDADNLSEEEMQAIARWTNLSETTFVQSSKQADASYRVRIFTPDGELPFAGHPSIGTAHAYWERAAQAAVPGSFLQECGAGLIQLIGDQSSGAQEIFVVSPTPKVEAVPSEFRAALESAVGATLSASIELLIIDVGPRWIVSRLDDESSLQSLVPDMSGLARLSHALNVTGLTVYTEASLMGYDLRVRSFAPVVGVSEDPVCGSGNIGVAAHLLATGRLSSDHSQLVVTQGSEIGRNGRVVIRVADSGASIAVGGQCVTRMHGKVRIGTG